MHNNFAIKVSLFNHVPDDLNHRIDEIVNTTVSATPFYENYSKLKVDQSQSFFSNKTTFIALFTILR